jgi:hypothetical protein
VCDLGLSKISSQRRTGSAAEADGAGGGGGWGRRPAAEASGGEGSRVTGGRGGGGSTTPPRRWICRRPLDDEPPLAASEQVGTTSPPPRRAPARHAPRPPRAPLHDKLPVCPPLLSALFCKSSLVFLLKFELQAWILEKHWINVCLYCKFMRKLNKCMPFPWIVGSDSQYMYLFISV